MANVVRLLVKQDTVLKQEPIQAGQLPSNKLQKIPAGTLLVLQSFGIVPGNNSHIKLSFKDLDFKGFANNWYIFRDHAEILERPFTPVSTIKQSAFNQQTKNVVEILAYLDKQKTPAQGGFVKLVFNQDTLIKRRPVESRFLNAASLQKIPAGTELVLWTNKPDVHNSIKFPIESNHLQFDLKDAEFKGYSQDWYVFEDHAGLKLNS